LGNRRFASCSRTLTTAFDDEVTVKACAPAAVAAGVVAVLGVDAAGAVGVVVAGVALACDEPPPHAASRNAATARRRG
jgi:hypothetical protein